MPEEPRKLTERLEETASLPPGSQERFNGWGVAGALLGLGRVGLRGKVPNGQRFIASPRVLWTIPDSRAEFRGEDFGAPGPVHPQARLRDFWIPQRGILAMGQSYFDPFDPALHSSGAANRTGKRSG